MNDLKKLERLSNTMICQRCHKTADELKALNEYIILDGYAHCRDCYSDLEYASVVLRQVHYDRKRKYGVPLPKWLNEILIGKGLLVRKPLPETRLLFK